MGPHLRNKFIGFIVVWTTANLLYSYCLYFVCLLEYTGQQEHGVCCISTLLPALCVFLFTFVLFQRLWLFVTTLRISCCLICHRAGQLVEFLKLATSTRTQRSLQVSLLIWFASSDFSFLDSLFLPLVIAVLWNIGCCRTFTPSSALFNFFIFCIVHVQPFFFSCDVETSFCLCGKCCSWARS